MTALKLIRKGKRLAVLLCEGDIGVARQAPARTTQHPVRKIGGRQVARRTNRLQDSFRYKASARGDLKNAHARLKPRNCSKVSPTRTETWLPNTSSYPAAAALP
jgi:hypothetical protein